MKSLPARMFRGTTGRRIRRGFPIAGYVGPNGSGKTAAMVWDTIPSLEQGRKVLSTVRLLDYENPRPCDDGACISADHATHQAAHPGYVPFTDWRQFMDWFGGDILMDEVTGVASSRESHSMPGPVTNLLNQLRRRDVCLRWSAPSWGRADIVIRQCTQSVTSCRGLFAVDVPMVEGEAERMWRHRRLFSWKTFDAYAFEDFTAGTRERLKAWNADRHWGPGSVVFDAYDTFDSVLAIGSVSDAGRCMNCGGRRSAPPCSCPGYVAPKRSRAGASGAGAPLAGSAPEVSTRRNGETTRTRSGSPVHGNRFRAGPD